MNQIPRMHQFLQQKNALEKKIFSISLIKETSDLETSSDHGLKRAKIQEREPVHLADLTHLDDLPNSSYFQGIPFDVRFLFNIYLFIYFSPF